MNGFKSIRNSFALALAAIVFAACGGGAGGGGSTGSLPQAPGASATPMQTPSPQPAASPVATAAFTIAVPANLGTAAATKDPRHPLYVSPNTNSVGISLSAVNGKLVSVPATVAKIGYGLSGCTAASPAPLTCTISVTVPAQSYDTIAVATYSSSNGSGTPLSQSTITQTFAANQQINVPLALGGVVASIAASPSVIHTVQGGGVSSYLLSVTPKDASGAVILGTTSFQSPISISIQNDPNNALSASENIISSPGTPVQIHYDGSKVLGDGKIVASSGALGSAAADIIPLSFTPNSVTVQMGSGAQQIAVSEAGFTGQFSASVDLPSIATANVVSTGPGTATVNIVPAALGGTAGTANVSISDGPRSAKVPVKITLPQLPGITYYGPFTGFTPVNMTLGQNGKIYLASITGSIAEFDPSTAGMTQYTLHSFGFGVPQGITTDNSGNVWVAYNTFPGKLCEMTLPTHAIACYKTGLTAKTRIYGVARGTDGAIWFCDQGTPAIGRIDPVTDVITEYTMGLPSSAQPYGIAAGNDGNMYFSDVSSAPAFGSVSIASGAIAEYTSGLALYDPKTQLESTPYHITLGSDGNIWAADPDYRSIDQFIISQHQTVQHTNGIQNFGNPWAITSAPNGDVWFTDAGFFAPAALGDVKLSSAFTQEYSGFPPAASFSVNGLVFTSAHDLWFLDQNAHSMGHVTIP